MSRHPAPGVVDDEGEAFARAVFGRFLRQATICQDIDDAVEHMHIVNDDSQTFDIRLGGEVRIPVGRELILALAAKKKELLGLCESALRRSKARDASPATAGAGASSADSSLRPEHHHPQAVVFPPPTALSAMQAVAGSMADVRGKKSSGADGVAVIPDVVRSAEVFGSGGGGAPGVEMRAPVVAAEPSASAPVAYVSTSVPPPTRSRPVKVSSPTTVFVRKLDARVDKDALIKHFSTFGEVIAISMNPSRGYAFVDYPSHECVLRAVSTTAHTVGHRNLVVEAKKEPPKEMPNGLPRYVRR